MCLCLLLLGHSYTGVEPIYICLYKRPDESGTLIIKIPSIEHEEAHTNFVIMVIEDALSMGISRRERWVLGSKTQITQPGPRSPLYSAKEGDSSWTNLITRPREDSWPVFVVEAGNSESLAPLKADARWLLEKSNGEVLMVIVIKVNKRHNTIQLLKYIPTPDPTTTYSFRNQSMVLPSLVADISIDISTVPPQVQGGPLTLEFNRLFDRAPNPLRRAISS